VRDTDPEVLRHLALIQTSVQPPSSQFSRCRNDARSAVGAMRQRESAVGLHEQSFGQPPTGSFFETIFRIASFQSPSIFKTSGSGPGGFRGFLAFAFDFFTAIRMVCVANC